MIPFVSFCCIIAQSNLLSTSSLTLTADDIALVITTSQVCDLNDLYHCKNARQMLIARIFQVSDKKHNILISANRDD